MYKVIVITDPETADGFRFAGVDVISVDTADAAREQVKHLLDGPDSGILALNESYYYALDEKTVERRQHLPAHRDPPAGQGEHRDGRRAPCLPGPPHPPRRGVRYNAQG